MWVPHVITADNFQLDMVFAVANAEGRSPVKVSAEGNLPKAGSFEAEQVMGRATTLNPTNNQGVKRYDAGGEVRHREKRSGDTAP